MHELRDTVVSARPSHTLPGDFIERLRIAFVLSAKSVGGAEVNLFDFLVRRRSEVEAVVILLNPTARLMERASVSGATIVAAPGSAPVQFVALGRLLREFRPHVVHSYGVRANSLARILKPLHRGHVVSALVGADPERPTLHVWVDRITAPLVDMWLANSRAGWEVERHRLGLDPTKGIVIHNGVDTRHFQPPQDPAAARLRVGLSPETRAVVTVANILPMKGHLKIARAAPEIRRQVGATAFLFVGDDLMNGQIRKAIEAEGLAAGIKWLGPQDDVRTYLAAADLFLLPSDHEGLPTSIIEAMAMGVPVVASDVGGVPELVIDGETGLLIPPDDPVRLVTSVSELLADPRRASEYGARGRDRVVKRFSLERANRCLLEAYRRLARVNSGAGVC